MRPTPPPVENKDQPWKNTIKASDLPPFTRFPMPGLFDGRGI